MSAVPMFGDMMENGGGGRGRGKNGCQVLSISPYPCSSLFIPPKNETKELE